MWVWVSEGLRLESQTGRVIVNIPIKLEKLVICDGVATAYFISDISKAQISNVTNFSEHKLYFIFI